MTGAIRDNPHRGGKHDVRDHDSQPLYSRRTWVSERAERERLRELTNAVSRAEDGEKVHALARGRCRPGEHARDGGLSDEKRKPRESATTGARCRGLGHCAAARDAGPATKTAKISRDKRIIAFYNTTKPAEPATRHIPWTAQPPVLR